MPAQNTVVSTRIADALREQILSGTMVPGERIRQEELADEFGASRIPVREALRILVTDGLVTMVSNTGAWVSSLSQAECIEQYLIRERIEPLLLSESLPNLSPATIERLRELTAAMESATDVVTFMKFDREFHLLTYSGAPNGTLAEIIHRLWNTTQHYRRAYSELVRGTSLDVTHLEHRLLVDAISRGDVEDAERTLTGHIQRTRRELEKHPEVFEVTGA